MVFLAKLLKHLLITNYLLLQSSIETYVQLTSSYTQTFARNFILIRYEFIFLVILQPFLGEKGKTRVVTSKRQFQIWLKIKN